MPQVTESLILEALKQVTGPGFSDNIVALGQVKNIEINGKDVSFDVTLPAPEGPLRAEMTRLSKEALQKNLPEIGEIHINFPVQATGGGPSTQETLLPDVHNIIAISSGKGGVGKSTVSVNLAVALAETGARVGLLDADIYGPNVPLMMGIKTPPEPEGEKIAPAENHGVRFISMAFFVPEETPMIWRGPMIHGAIQQLIRDVSWGALDFLLVDLPPGTGDAQLSIAQIVPLTGAVIVTTPQEVSLLDSKKGLAMFKKVNVPILGIVENMSYFECPHCHEATEIFSRGGGRTAAEKLDLSFLGEVPIDPAIRMGGDTGHPIVTSNPSSPQALAFMEIAKNLTEQVASKNSEKTSLNIIQ
ncbi:MAG: Mrp/NBP35 family ATP-binding protein [Nitrospiria bacterium]